MTVGPQQFWLGTGRAGQTVRFWIDTTTVHMSIAGWRIKTVPSRLSAVDLASPRKAGARRAGPPPAGPVPGALAASSCVEVQRLVNSAGIITLGIQVIQVGSPAGGSDICFQAAPAYAPPSWPDPASSMQMHLDFDVDDLDATEARVLAAGATKYAVQPNDHCPVYADPAGHPFCLSTLATANLRQS